LGIALLLLSLVWIFQRKDLQDSSNPSLNSDPSIKSQQEKATAIATATATATEVSSTEASSSKLQKAAREGAQTSREAPVSSADASAPKALFEGEVELDENRLAFQQVFEDKTQKYPLTLVQRLWRISPQDPTYKEYLGERKMVADHLLVKLHSPSQEALFESHVLSFGMRIRKKMLSGALFIVEFDLDAHDALQKAKKRLLELPEVRSVSPDFMSQAVF
jgi:hypothetical protein